MPLVVVRLQPLVSLGLSSLGLSSGLLLLGGTHQAVVAAREPDIRVLLQESEQISLRADADRPFRLTGPDLGRIDLTRLQIELSSGGLSLVMEEAGAPADRPMRRRLPTSAQLRLETDDPRGLWLGKRRYGGSLRLLVHKGRIAVVNHLGIEDYLPSVVGSEMPQEWPMAALQAQAVAARTYALRQRGRAGLFDVQATVASQVYRGLESQTPRTLEAVQSTRSLVLVHAGQLINAVFHSSSGGATEASGEVWRSQLPYLVSVPDHDQQSPVHRWETRFDADQLRRAFRETGGVERLEVLESSTTGRVRALRVRGPVGVLRISGSELRQRLGLKSTMVEFNWLAAGEGEGAPSPSTPPSQLSSRWVGFLVDPDGDGISEQLSPPPPLPQQLRLRRRRPQPVLEVRGRGYGHGVGMSQWGARALAEQGAEFRQILQHYYQGVEIRPFRPSDDPAVARLPQLEPAWRG